jgi:hypothetical protein
MVSFSGLKERIEDTTMSIAIKTCLRLLCLAALVVSASVLLPACVYVGDAGIRDAQNLARFPQALADGGARDIKIYSVAR